jgi:leucine dehydrogenase
MTTPWGYPDFDAHEALHFVTDEKSGLRAILRVGGGGERGCGTMPMARHPDRCAQNPGHELQKRHDRLAAWRGQGRCAGQPDPDKTPEMLAAFGSAVNSLGGKYVTAEDVGMSVADDRDFEADQICCRSPGRRSGLAAIPARASLGVFRRDQGRGRPRSAG